MKEIKLINANDLYDIILKDREELNIHETPEGCSVHNGEYSHFLVRITQMPEAYNVKERVDNVVKSLLAEKEYELSGVYNNEMERMIAEKKMEWRNELIDDVIEIVRKGFEI